MPRKKSFDVEEAVRAAMDTFWNHGYERTSIDDLTEATGVKRQSLYNALGEKREMFVKALLKYDLEERRNALAQVEATQSGRGAIEYLFTLLVEHCSKDKTRRGCFLVNTALEAGHDNDVQAIVSEAMRDFQKFFERSLKRGQDEREISRGVDAASVSSALLSMYIGIRVLARGKGQGAVIKDVANQAQRLLDG